MRWLIIALMVALLASFGSGVCAEEYKCALSYGLFTHHYRSKAANEGFENRMVALEYRNLVFSEFSNSYNEETVFFGYAFHTDKIESKTPNWWFRANLYTGVLIGYGEKNPANWHGIGLGVYPTGSIGYKQYSLETGIMPTFFWFALKYEF